MASEGELSGDKIYDREDQQNRQVSSAGEILSRKFTRRDHSK